MEKDIKQKKQAHSGEQRDSNREVCHDQTMALQNMTMLLQPPLQVQQRQYGLVEHLKTWCRVNQDYEILFASLKVDMEEYADILDSVTMFYPNYSKHDASHSKAIIRYIDLLLGKEQIAKLSATDTWMLLEAAYGHDIGMAITKEEISQIWNAPAFREFLIKQINGSNAEMRISASVIYDLEKSRFKTLEEAIEKLRCSLDDSLPALALGAEIQKLLAEYIRQEHAERSGALQKRIRWYEAETINGIPNRLYKYCSECSIAHGLSRMDIITKKANDLQEVTQGFSLDEAHPRFVAMLLRLADLLDIDNNRFNKYIVAAYGELSERSLAHKDKHRCITHLYISPTRIELASDLTRLLDSQTAEENKAHSQPSSDRRLNAYEETLKWFSWIEEELAFWNTYGYMFIPDGFFPKVPVLARRDILINGKNYGKENLLDRFQITYERAFEIIGGKPFYNEPLSFVRELVQNAFDAYKYRVLNLMRDDIEDLRKGVKITKKDFSMFYSKTLEKLKLAKIRLLFLIDQDIPSSNSRISLVISDNGEGISDESYERMRSVGEWGKRGYDQSLLPGWIKTTGEFGIGIHSAFSMTKRIFYRTYCLSSMKRRQIMLTKEHYNGCAIILPTDECELPEREECGTDLWLAIERKKLVQALIHDDSHDLSEERLIELFLDQLFKTLAPNIANLDIEIYYEPKGKVALDRLIAGKSGPHSPYIQLSVPSIFDISSFTQILECPAFYYAADCSVGKDGMICSIITLNKSTPFDGSQNNICLRLNLDSAEETLKISHKGSWLHQTEQQNLRLKGMCAELHILGRGARKTVNTSREYLLPHAVNEIRRDMNQAFRQLLLFICTERKNTMPLRQIENDDVRNALALHYRALLCAKPDDKARALAETALAEINKTDEEMEAYYFAGFDQNSNALELETVMRFVPHCEAPENFSWLRQNALFTIPRRLSPEVGRCGVEYECYLYEDLWGGMEIDLTVCELYALECEMQLPALVVRYKVGRTCAPAKTNLISYTLMLESWLRRACTADPIQMLPAVWIEEDPQNPIHQLAIRGGDYQADQEWPLFRTFVKMPILKYAERFPLAKGARTKVQDNYGNLAVRRPAYLETLVDYTYCNQLEPERYSREQIRESYKKLLEMLDNTGNKYNRE